MRYLLDTNVCIMYLNGSSERIRNHVESLSFQEICLCSVVKAELVYGAMKSGNPNKNLGRLAVFARRFYSFPFDDNAADSYGRIRSQLEKSGSPIGPNDMMIGAIAVTNHLTLVTHNTREFCRIDGLLVKDWEVAQAPI